MRWATYISPTTRAARVGVVQGRSIHGLAEPTALIDLLGDDGERLAAAGDRALRDPAEVISEETATLLAPIPRPPSVRDFAAFEAHIAAFMETWGREINPDWYTRPIFYFQNPAAICGPGDVAIPPGCRHFDYELEFCAIVGRDGADLTPDNAESHIAGYTVLCDWSARDLHEEERVHLIGPMKGKDSATSIGPYLVTPDELEPARSGQAFDLRMTADVNGVRYSEGSLDTIHWSFAQMLTFASRGTRVQTGDVIGTGTVETGALMELKLREEDRYAWLQPGDEVALEIERIGRLVNRIVPGVEPIPYI